MRRDGPEAVVPLRRPRGMGLGPAAVASRTRLYRRALAAACGPGDLERVFEALVVAASSGDVAAAKLVLAYTVGLPTVHLEVAERQRLAPRELPPREDWEAWARRVDEYVRSVTE